MMPETRDLGTVPLTINLLNGEFHKNVNPCTAMQVYVKAHVKGQKNLPGEKKKRQKTTVDKRNGARPIWNLQMTFNIDQKKLLEEGERGLELVLEAKVGSPVFLFHTSLGTARLPVKELYDGVRAEEMMTWTSVRCHVWGRSGKYKGDIFLSYRFGLHGDEVEYGKNDVVAVASAPPLPPCMASPPTFGQWSDG